MNEHNFGYLVDIGLYAHLLQGNPDVLLVYLAFLVRVKLTEHSLDNLFTNDLLQISCRHQELSVVYFVVI